MVDSRDMSAQLIEWVIARRNPPSIAYVVLSAVAAVASYVIARLFHLPEAYWAPMSALIVMQLTLSAAIPIAVQYVVGTAVGAAFGAAADIYFHTSVWAFRSSNCPCRIAVRCTSHREKCISIRLYYPRDRHARTSIYEQRVSGAAQILRGFDRHRGRACALRRLAEDRPAISSQGEARVRLTCPHSRAKT